MAEIVPASPSSSGVAGEEDDSSVDCGSVVAVDAVVSSRLELLLRFRFLLLPLRLALRLAFRGVDGVAAG